LRSCVKLGGGAGVLSIACLIILLLSLDVFSTLKHIRLGFSHPLVLGVLHYIYSQPLDLMGIHIFCCVHHEKRMALHDVVRGAFVTIAENAIFHVF